MPENIATVFHENYRGSVLRAFRTHCPGGIHHFKVLFRTLFILKKSYACLILEEYIYTIQVQSAG